MMINLSCSSFLLLKKGSGNPSITWERMAENLLDPCMFINGTDPGDVIQVSLSYFVSLTIFRVL
jgi:hypothetical protein